MEQSKNFLSNNLRDIGVFLLALILSVVFIFFFVKDTDKDDKIITPTPSVGLEPTEEPKDRMQIIKDDNPRDLDDFALNSASLRGEYIYVEVGYSGGCEKHEFILSMPSQIITLGGPVPLHLAHNSKGDMCEAYITEELVFDLGDVGFTDFVIESFDKTIMAQVVDEPEELSLDELLSSVQDYDESRVKVEGSIEFSTICTLKACPGESDGTVCNNCWTNPELTGDKVPSKLKLSGIAECADHNSQSTQTELPRCKDIGLVDGKDYIIEGIVKNHPIKEGYDYYLSVESFQQVESSELERVLVADLFENLVEYDGKTIETFANLEIRTSCTKIACLGESDQTICNNCFSSFAMLNSAVPEKLELKGIECADHNSNITQVDLQRCKDIDIFEDVRYLLKGTIKQEFNANLDSVQFVFEVAEYKMDLDRTF